MKVRLLGTAAGGGFPQWNCNCKVCHIARKQPHRAIGRTQSGVAVCSNDKQWFLLNASPDLLLQMSRIPDFRVHPECNSIRYNSIQSVLLTNADLDHVLGLFLLREGTSLRICATKAVQMALNESLRLGP